MTHRFWTNPWFMIPALVFLNAGMGLLLVVPYGDEILFFNSWRTEPLNSLFRFLTQMAEAPAFLVAAGLALFWRYRFALVIALAGILITILAFTLKDQLGVDRPATYFKKEGLFEQIVLVPGVELNTGQTSFPSGHSMAAFGLYGVLALCTRRRFPWLGLACAWTAILVCISRIFLVQHFLTDVLSGAMLGMAVAGFVWHINRRYLEKLTFLNRRLLQREPDSNQHTA